eukprot:8274659-Pyramimonas_sp.AAC.1
MIDGVPIATPEEARSSKDFEEPPTDQSAARAFRYRIYAKQSQLGMAALSGKKAQLDVKETEFKIS